jgi:hypothetical protein
VIGLPDEGHVTGAAVVCTGHCDKPLMHWDEQDQHESTQLPLSMHMNALHC